MSEKLVQQKTEPQLQLKMMLMYVWGEHIYICMCGGGCIYLSVYANAHC